MSPSEHRANLRPSVDVAVSARVQGIRWRISRGREELVTGPRAPDWQDLDSLPNACQIKRGHGRTTWRVVVGEVQIFAKIFQAKGVRERLRRLVVGDPTWREWRAVHRARALGVAVAAPVAVGMSGSTTIYLSEGVDQGVSLPTAWQSPTGRSSLQGIIRAVAELFATAHERGFDHGDAHPHNILVREDGRGHWGAFFLDVHSAVFSRGPLALNDALKGIAQLDQFFQRRATRGDRMRFLREYLSRRAGLDPGRGGSPTMREVLTTYHSVSARHAERLARRRDRRLWGDGKYFTTLRLAGGWRATVALTLERRHVFPEPDVPDRTRDEWVHILESALVRLTIAAPCSLTVEGVCLEVRPLGVMGGLTEVLVGDAERGKFEASHHSRHRDRPAPLVLGYLRRGFRCWPSAVGIVCPPGIRDSSGVREGD